MSWGQVLHTWPLHPAAASRAFLHHKHRIVHTLPGGRPCGALSVMVLAHRHCGVDMGQEQRDEEEGASSHVTLIDFPVLCVDTCLLYTSDAADEEDSVDLGGRRIIKKKKKKNNHSADITYNKNRRQQRKE
eukprot:TRINITY_DN5774_c0_g2_i2.p2 TRINITY_DN5774_c0_g2~~TRINITY_DN5774_c0_g2_i2.p2  ORF type:complete len:131 (-),score=20.85 TRINITY_DN5774_c0_g2_i2:15-407(-)